MNLPAPHLALLVGYALVLAIGNLMLEAGAARLPAGASWADGASAALGNGYLWFGLILYGCAFVLWVWLLSFIPLRYAYPVAVSSIIFAPLLSGLVTRAFPQPSYWFGVFLVIAGLTVVVTK